MGGLRSGAGRCTGPSMRTCRCSRISTAWETPPSLNRTGPRSKLTNQSSTSSSKVNQLPPAKLNFERFQMPLHRQWRRLEKLGFPSPLETRKAYPPIAPSFVICGKSVRAGTV
uniref:Uncharacterized protein n=1 Tax=mine drainage metagenome TaxID=410659 RepID=E6PP87_9ZZZZ